MTSPILDSKKNDQQSKNTNDGNRPASKLVFREGIGIIGDAFLVGDKGALLGGGPTDGIREFSPTSHTDTSNLLPSKRTTRLRLIVQDAVLGEGSVTLRRKGHGSRDTLECQRAQALCHNPAIAPISGKQRCEC